MQGKRKVEVAIVCEDCGATRWTVACAPKSIKRCIPCQQKVNIKRTAKSRLDAIHKRWITHPEEKEAFIQARAKWCEENKLSADDLMQCYLDHPGEFHQFVGDRRTCRLTPLGGEVK